MDHAQLVHKQWTQVAEQGLRIHVVRVGTHDNIADLPSRRAYRMLESAGVTWVSPILKDEYWTSSTWESLHEAWRL